MISFQTIIMSASSDTHISALAETLCNISRRHHCSVEVTFNGVRLCKALGDGFNRHDIERVYYSTVATELHKRV